MTLRVLGIVPARGGSKGVPRKNERLLGGRTLIERARDAASESGVIDRLVLSTDSESIAALGKTLGIDVPFMRPAHLATDESPMLGVVEHALDALAGDGYRPDAVALLQPTSPLRRADHIADAVDLLVGDATSVVSVTAIPPHLAPHYAMRIDGPHLVPFLSEGAAVTRRQDVPPAYFRNGTIYLTRVEVVLEQHDLYGTRCIPLEIPAEDALSIDTEDDWELAERRLTGAA
ncbi:MAG: acylneuraminate cytidylyltransferase family protein [Gaiellaceae bacterium]